MKDTQKSTGNATTDTTAEGFTAEERAAMKERHVADVLRPDGADRRR